MSKKSKKVSVAKNTKISRSKEKKLQDKPGGSNTGKYAKVKKTTSLVKPEEPPPIASLSIHSPEHAARLHGRILPPILKVLGEMFGLNILN